MTFQNSHSTFIPMQDEPLARLPSTIFPGSELSYSFRPARIARIAPTLSGSLHSRAVPTLGRLGTRSGTGSS